MESIPVVDTKQETYHIYAFKAAYINNTESFGSVNFVPKFRLVILLFVRQIWIQNVFMLCAEKLGLLYSNS
jgi:hypothetical protein